MWLCLSKRKPQTCSTSNEYEKLAESVSFHGVLTRFYNNEHMSIGQSTDNMIITHKVCHCFVEKLLRILPLMSRCSTPESWGLQFWDQGFAFSPILALVFADHLHNHGLNASPSRRKSLEILCLWILIHLTWKSFSQHYPKYLLHNAFQHVIALITCSHDYIGVPCDFHLPRRTVTSGYYKCTGKGNAKQGSNTCCRPAVPCKSTGRVSPPFDSTALFLRSQRRFSDHIDQTRMSRYPVNAKLIWYLFYFQKSYNWCSSLGRRAAYWTLTHQKLTTGSTSEAGLIWVDDVKHQTLWTHVFVIAPYFYALDTIQIQDNKCAKLLENNHKANANRQTSFHSMIRHRQ